MRAVLVFSLMCMAQAAWAQEIADFGAWRAVCAPTAGCVIGTKNRIGEHVTLTSPPQGKAPQFLIFTPRPPEEGSVILIGFAEGGERVVADATTGWRLVTTEAGEAIEIALPLFKDALSKRMLKSEEMSLRYSVSSRRQAELVFSLIGYADAMGYAEGG